MADKPVLFAIALQDHYDQAYKAEILAASLEQQGEVLRSSIWLWHGDGLDELAKNRFREMGYKLLHRGLDDQPLEEACKNIINEWVFILSASHFILNSRSPVKTSGLQLSDDEWLLDLARAKNWAFHILPKNEAGMLSYEKLDGFGNIDIPQGIAAEEKSNIERANFFISKLPEQVFFQLYKRGLAKERILRSPSFPSKLFDRFLQWKEKSASNVSRIIFHIGAPKTGTTALQEYFLHHRRSLLEQHALWYPDPGPRPIHIHHLYLVDLFVADSPEDLIEHFFERLALIPSNAETLFFSFEYLHHLWCTEDRFFKRAFDCLAQIFKIELWMWFREPLEFSTAYYYQALRSHKPDLTNFYPDGTMESNIQGKWLTGLLDYIGILYEAEELIGKGNIRCFLYNRETIEDCFKALNIALPGPISREYNVTPGAVSIEILRIVNRYNYYVKKKKTIVELIREIEKMLGDKTPAYEPSEKVKDYVHMISDKGWKTLHNYFEEMHKQE